MTEKTSIIKWLRWWPEEINTPLAGERLRPLGHLSGAALIGGITLAIKRFFDLFRQNGALAILRVLAAENGTSRERVGTNDTNLAQQVLTMFYKEH